MGDNRDRMFRLFAYYSELNRVSASDVSAATGISPGALSDWRHGKSTPKVTNLMKIADYFGISLDELVREEKKIESKGDALICRLSAECRGLSEDQLNVLIKTAQVFKKNCK